MSKINNAKHRLSHKNTVIICANSTQRKYTDLVGSLYR